MKIFADKTHINFMGLRKPMSILFIVLTLVAIGALATRWLNLGLDFTGGTLIEVGYEQPADLDKVRKALADGNFKDAVVQHFGSARDVLVRLATREGVSSADLSTNVMKVLQAGGEKVEMRRVEFVGSQVGEELTEQGGLAMLYALAGIMVYVWLRFEWRFALSAVITTAHDTIFVLGWFSILGIEFDLTVMAAVLAVIGYSLNDTIVIFDRIRETFRTLRKATPVEVMNVALNDTLSRTIMTSGSTLMVVIALFYFGGAVIHGFALALIIGILIGTFSSLYVACPLALWLGVNKADLMPVKKEGAEVDARP
jgi:preprotein translocase subunit SecF